MGRRTAQGQAIYRERGSIAEDPNAVFRNRNLQQFLVRGLRKVKAVALWQALAYNLTRIQALCGGTLLGESPRRCAAG